MSVTDSLLVAFFLMVVVFLVLCGLFLVIEVFSNAYAVANLARKKKQRLHSQR